MWKPQAALGDGLCIQSLVHLHHLKRRPVKLEAPGRRASDDAAGMSAWDMLGEAPWKPCTENVSQRSGPGDRLRDQPAVAKEPHRASSQHVTRGLRRVPPIPAID